MGLQHSTAEPPMTVKHLGPLHLPNDKSVLRMLSRTFYPHWPTRMLPSGSRGSPCQVMLKGLGSKTGEMCEVWCEG